MVALDLALPPCHPNVKKSSKDFPLLAGSVCYLVQACALKLQTAQGLGGLLKYAQSWSIPIPCVYSSLSFTSLWLSVVLLFNSCLASNTKHWLILWCCMVSWFYQLIGRYFCNLLNMPFLCVFFSFEQSHNSTELHVDVRCRRACYSSIHYSVTVRM